MEKRFCTKCQSIIEEDNARFCPQCGRPITEKRTITTPITLNRSSFSTPRVPTPPPPITPAVEHESRLRTPIIPFNSVLAAIEEARRAKQQPQLDDLDANGIVLEEELIEEDEIELDEAEIVFIDPQPPAPVSPDPGNYLMVFPRRK